MPTEDWSQLVSCRDAADRPRDIKVLLGITEIVLRCPPGEIARLTPDESMLLRTALRDAERAHANRSPRRTQWTEHP